MSNWRGRIPLTRDELAAMRESGSAPVRYVILALENFLADQAHLRAAALTYTTLLSLVPVLAFSFALVRGLGFDDDVLNFVLHQFFPASDPAVYRDIMGYIDRVNVKTIGAVGLGSFLVTVIMTLNTVEHALNVIFGVHQARSAVRKFTDYFSILLLSPLLLSITISATTLFQFREWLLPFGLYWLFSEAATVVLKVVPLAGTFVLFSLILLVMPNTRIRAWPAVLGGLAGGVMWFFLQWTYVGFQVGFSRHQAIYGALAQLPILMVWIYLAWCTLFLAAELAAVAQGRPLAAAPAGAEEADPGELALRIMASLAHRSSRTEKPWLPEELASALDAPAEILETVLNRLETSGLLARTREEGRLLLGRHPAAIRAGEVWDTARAARPPADGAAPGLNALIEEVEHARKERLGDLTLEDLRTGGS